MTTTTGTATRIGTMARYRSIPPPAGTPWSCRTTRPATDAAIAVTSATGRRQGRADRRVSAVVMRAGLAGGAGLRCCHTAMAGGPASAARMATPASGHPAAAPPPGTKARARPAPISTPGPAVITAPRSVSPATCHSDPPRARRMASSPWRRATSIRAASRITAAPTTTRLTNRSRSTVSTAAWVLRNSARFCSSGEATVSAFAAGASAPVSVGVTAVARFTAA